MHAFALEAFNGLSYGLLLFMLSAGLTLIFSVQGVLNFAHASFYMLGAYVGYSIAARAGFLPALVLAPLAVGLLGAGCERWLLRRVQARGGHTSELLLTFGLAYLIGEAAKLLWGLAPLPAPVPPLLDGAPVSAFGVALPRYRLFMMAMSAAMLIALGVLLRASRIGLVVRAALTHRAAVEALGYDVPRVMTGLFGAGTALAALAGVIGAPLAVIEPALAETVGSVVFAIVVIGGLGSLGGAFVASLAVGFAQTCAASSDTSLRDLARWAGVALPDGVAAVSLAQLAPLVPYLLLVAVLAARPRGLFGERVDG
ncbi:branched-chain amino acid ABC transporter permease [Burkholderia vietnamiensis]|uniref:branched-chain amino acid ABC transporter permease n=1 Tax=Burkholderia vietnamiensis TaxID=60552 RepID=UPI001B9054F9|nr:branched-chain amino acid ABC transporter permease [Burkholderia vietnamiensis]MBR7977216.1 branched-chain amino acid ABC transporter permease [Burkholderia vietnamiensis]